MQGTVGAGRPPSGGITLAADQMGSTLDTNGVAAKVMITIIIMMISLVADKWGQHERRRCQSNEF